jgi:hypothetical protein
MGGLRFKEACKDQLQCQINQIDRSQNTELDDLVNGVKVSEIGEPLILGQ